MLFNSVLDLWNCNLIKNEKSFSASLTWSERFDYFLLGSRSRSRIDFDRWRQLERFLACVWQAFLRFSLDLDRRLDRYDLAAFELHVHALWRLKDQHLLTGLQYYAATLRLIGGDDDVQGERHLLGGHPLPLPVFGWYPSRRPITAWNKSLVKGWPNSWKILIGYENW